MKQKLIKNYFLKETSYNKFFKEKKSRILRKTFINFPELSNNRITFDKNPKFGQFTNTKKNNTSVSSFSRSLKKITLNSTYYSNYIDYFLNRTQEHSFKTPKVINNPILKSKEYFPFKFQKLTTKDLKKENTQITSETSNSLFVNYIKEIKSEKKIIEEKPYGFQYGKTKIIFDKSKMEKENSYSAQKDFGELCDINVFESKFLKKVGIKNIDMNNCYEEKQKVLNFYMNL